MSTDLGLLFARVDITSSKLLDHVQVFYSTIWRENTEVLSHWTEGRIAKRLGGSVILPAFWVAEEQSALRYLTIVYPTHMSSYGTSHRLGLSVTKAIDPVVFQEIAKRGIASRGRYAWRKSSCEKVPEECNAHSACESAKSMS